jgi:hypothetical protein
MAQLDSSVVYTDITEVAGVGLQGKLTESLAWGDYDKDGDEDLYLTSDGPNNLFRNDGGGMFTDVTDVAGVGSAAFSVGTAFGDLDNDGDLDLYVVSFQGGADVLYRNDGAEGPGGEFVFTDITQAAGTTDERSSRGVTFIDYDHDGLLDMYVNAIGRDILYHNLGGLKFTNVAGQLGVATEGQGVGVVATDLDNNGWVDLFTGNRSGDPNRLYLNDEGIFSDVTFSAGIDEVGLGMGVISLDYDNDLDFDLYWTAWPTVSNALYENIDGSSFVNVATKSLTTDAGGWGISANAGDIDNDGWEDFFVTNGFSTESSANVLFHNAGDGTFIDRTSVIGGGAFDGRGVAFADFDEDGDVDLCVTGGPNVATRLWRNDTINGNHWITIRLEGKRSNRSGIGSRIEVTTGQLTLAKEVSGGAGRGSQNSLPVEFGLGSAIDPVEVVVYWPSGIVQTISEAALNQHLTIREAPDVNLDGAVDAIDIQMVINVLLGIDATGLDADIDCNGAVEALDVQGVINTVLGV